MKKLITKAIVFLLPFTVFFAAIATVDPFDYYNFFNAVPGEVKEGVSQKLNYTLWKIPHFKRNPSPHILLGDSRMHNLDAEKIEIFSGLSFYNLAYGGGTLAEIINTFWIAAGETRLKTVCIGINFNLYNEYNRMDRTKEVLAICESPLLYLINKTVLKAACYTVIAGLSPKGTHIGLPGMSREEFWKHQLLEVTDRYYSRYKYPEGWHRELLKIVEYCRNNDVRLFFIIFPTHADLQKRVLDYDLDPQYRRFKKDIHLLGITYDFDLSSPLTVNEKNFKDPYHYGEVLEEVIIRTVWGKEGNKMKGLVDIRGVQ